MQNGFLLPSPIILAGTEKSLKILGWYTCSINFSNAFIQATLKDQTFIHLPCGFRGSGNHKTCLS